MSKKVHVIQRHETIGESSAFSYADDYFSELLDTAGADVQHQDGNELDFECELANYKTAIKVVACLANRNEDDPYRVALFEKVGATTKELTELVRKCWKADHDEEHGTAYSPEKAAKYVLSYMVTFLIQRDRLWDWVSFTTY